MTVDGFRYQIESRRGRDPGSAEAFFLIAGAFNEKRPCPQFAIVEYARRLDALPDTSFQCQPLGFIDEHD